jgi:hypothetical protein
MLVFSRKNVGRWGQVHQGDVRVCCGDSHTSLLSVDVNHWWVLKPLYDRQRPWSYVRERHGQGVLVGRTADNDTYDVEYFWDTGPAHETRIAAHVAHYTQLPQ